ncbi:hypothetical protein KDK_71370 [Dictyobacter kobayashii]|uniref:Uncharacterized protein n=1 Tax=Dictyobacter kobayashii TaxID=2014872 RepID=A0A402AW69_9CHLR|nr:hypothetical protein [Dictyobacter kobayashii]GCE23337.1 hypothetical protein KDK_71370 [Dictyobacter kobayashii]
MQKTIGIEQLTIRLARREDVAAIVHMLADDMLGQQRELDQDPLPRRIMLHLSRLTAIQTMN